MNNNAASLVSPDGLKVGSELRKAWGQREDIRSTFQKEMDEIMAYLGAMRMSMSGMDWDGGKSFSVTDATYRDYLGFSRIMAGFQSIYLGSFVCNYAGEGAGRGSTDDATSVSPDGASDGDGDPQDKKGDNTEKKAGDTQQGYHPAPKEGLPGFPKAGKEDITKEAVGGVGKIKMVIY